MKPPKQHGNVKFLEWENAWKKKTTTEKALKSI